MLTNHTCMHTYNSLNILIHSLECQSAIRTVHNPQYASNPSRIHFVQQTNNFTVTEFNIAVTERVLESSAPTVPVENEGILELDTRIAVSIVSYANSTKQFCLR